jgi:hypothetical protein
MRYSAAIFVMLGVTLGLSTGTAIAQTERSFSLFDLFEVGPPNEEYEIPPPDEEFAAPPVIRKRENTAKRAPRKSMFDLFPPGRERSTRATTKKSRTLSTQEASELAPKPRIRPQSAEVTNVAKEKRRLQALAARLQKQRQALDAEARRLHAEADQQKEERKRLVKGKLEKSPGEPIEGTPTARPPIGFETDNGDLGASGRETVFRRSDKTHLARAEPSSPPSAGTGKAGPESPKCKKAKAVIEGFAFSNVEAKACDGKTYLFSATRDKSTFSIKISSQTWELIEVSRSEAQAGE